MKYKVEMYGPYGPMQRGAAHIVEFSTNEERQTYLDKPRQLDTVRKVFEE